MVSIPMKNWFLEQSLFSKFWFLLHLFCLVVASIFLLSFMGAGGAPLVMHVPSGGGIEPPIDIHLPHWEEIQAQQQKEAEKNVQEQMRERGCAKKK